MSLQQDNLKLSSAALHPVHLPSMLSFAVVLLSKALPAFSPVSKALEAFETLQVSLD